MSTAILTADERAILRILANGPATLRDLLATLAPIPADASWCLPGAWTTARLKLRAADKRLLVWGLVERHNPGTRRITQAGRAALGAPAP